MNLNGGFSMSFADTFEAAASRHRNLLLAAPVLGLIVGFVARPLAESPEMLAAMGIYVGSFVTLAICAKVVGGSFRDSGATSPDGTPAPHSVYVSHLVLVVTLSWLARTLMALTLLPFQVGSGASAGALFELALAADRAYMFEDDGVSIALSALNGGTYPMGNGLTRLQTRFLADPERAQRILVIRIPV